MTLSMRGKRLSSLTRQEIELFGLIAKHCIWHNPNTSHLDCTIPVVKQGSCSIVLLSRRHWETGQDRGNSELTSPRGNVIENAGVASRLFSDCLCRSQIWTLWGICELTLKITVLKHLSKQCDPVWAHVIWRKNDTAQIQVCRAGCGTPKMT